MRWPLTLYQTMPSYDDPEDVFEGIVGTGENAGFSIQDCFKVALLGKDGRHFVSSSYQNNLQLSSTSIWKVEHRSVSSFIIPGHPQSSPCQDIDPAACKLVAEQDPDVCKNVALAETMCPKFCELCPKTCYHCANPVGQTQNCNSTTVCPRGEMCYIRTLTSSSDGHIEHMVGCASQQQCDGVAPAALIGRRNIYIHCCNEDLCNDSSGSHAVTTPTTKTASTVESSTATMSMNSMTTTDQTPTTPAGCARDVLFMMSKSRGTTRSMSHKMLDFMGHIIQQFDIGIHDALFALATYDVDVHERWNFARYQTKPELLAAVNQTSGFSSFINVIEYDDVIKYIGLYKIPGDRSNVPTKAVIFIDHKDIAHYLTTVRRYPHFGSYVNVVTIGITGNLEAFSSLAADSGHRLHVSGYGSLNTIESKLVQFICS